MEESANPRPVITVDAEQFQQLINAVNSLTGFKSDVEKMLCDHLKLKTYSVVQAHIETGLSYKKINNACKSGELKAIPDLKGYKISHFDLMEFLKKQKQ